jgi:hypothetical protein
MYSAVSGRKYSGRFFVISPNIEAYNIRLRLKKEVFLCVRTIMKRQGI